MNKIFSISIAWFTAILISLAIVKLTSIGDVILVISESRGMGVHSFDLITIIPMTVAALITVVKLKSD